jgi:lysozyme
MNISNAGLNLIKQFEGIRLKAYLCPAGVLTIGYGHTLNVKVGQVITEAEAELLLMKDLIPVENAIESLVKIELSQGQYDSLCSFIFNLGVSAFRMSTLLRQLNKGNYVEAAEEILKWNKANGQVNKGLMIRRQAEHRMFLQC